MKLRPFYCPDSDEKCGCRNDAAAAPAPAAAAAVVVDVDAVVAVVAVAIPNGQFLGMLETN